MNFQGLAIAVISVTLINVSGFASPSKSTKDLQKQVQVVTPPPSIEGTTWTGTDSEGDYYEYTFLRGGQLRFKVRRDNGELQTYEDPGDEWAQAGAVVIIVTSKFATRQGRITHGVLKGDAWNVRGHRWTWTATQRQ